jgi:hemolysin activation/secretion protein
MVTAVVRPSRPVRSCVAAALLGACALFCGYAAMAQSIAPSQVTPETLRPPPIAPNGGFVLPGPGGLAVPAGAERLWVKPGSVVIEGGFAELAQANEAARARLRRRLTVAEIYRIAGALEEAYAAAGYVLVRVVIPPQHLEDGGRLRIVVVDGFIEAVDVSALPERVRYVVAARTAMLVGRRHMTLAEIERHVLIAGDVPGLALRSTLVRGDRPGGTRIVLEGRHQLVTASVGADDRLPNSLGTWGINSTVAINSGLGMGEQLYGSLTTGSDLIGGIEGTSAIRVGGVGMVLPLGVDGWLFNPEFTSSVTHPITVPGVPTTTGHFERLALRSSYAVVRTRTETLTLTESFEYLTQQSDAVDFGTELNHDRYGALRARVEWTRLLTGARTLFATATLSQGTGGLTQADALFSGVPLSRLGAEPTFSKFNGDARLLQPLWDPYQIAFIARGQTSFGEPLFTSEGFGLDGLEAASGFPQGTFVVDEGVTGRIEVSRSFGVAWPWFVGNAAPYVFGAAGWGWVHQPTAVAQSSIDAQSLGLGLRTFLDAFGGWTGTTLGVEAAWRFSNVVGEHEGYRINATATLRF